jgi:membrane protein DedA with SNARE-associated domain
VTTFGAVLVFRFPHYVHHHVDGPPFDYVTLGLAAAASWIGLPGPGEAALIAAGVLAARHRLDIGSVVFVAWAGATAGGVGGWVVGLKAGRPVLTAPGPLRAARLGALARGERFYGRYGTLAVFMTPSWVAGAHQMTWTRYLPANALAAMLWALFIGLGSFLAGPSVGDVASDIGLFGSLSLAALLVAGLVAGRVERRRRSGRKAR